VQALWDFSQRDSFVIGMHEQRTATKAKLKSKQPEVRFAGTGDGFYLVIWNYEPNHFIELYEFARRLIGHAQSKKSDLKVVLHLDSASTVGIAKPRGKEDETVRSTRGWEALAGSGLNYSQRIVDYVNAGQVALTEEFLGSWPKNKMRNLPIQLYPKESEPLIRIYVKHNIVLRVRLDTAQASILLRKTTLVAAAIMVELERLADYVERKLLETEGIQTNARLTIFTPTYDSPTVSYLDCTPYRVCRHEEYKVSSRTAYVVSGENSTGLGKTYVAGVPSHLLNLPDFSKDQSKYCAMVQRKWGVQASETKKWTRHARAFFSIPIGLENLSSTPTAVLCVDLDDPLSKMTKPKADKFANLVLSEVQQKLSYLLELVTRY